MFGFLDSVTKLPKSLYAAIGVLLVLGLGSLDYLTGYEFSFSIFYLVPVSLAAWAAGIFLGVFISVVAAATWLAADALGGHSYSHPYIPFWNAAVRLGYFLIVASLVAKLRISLEHERRASREDHLTRVGNARMFGDVAAMEIRRVQRYPRPFTLAYIDLDNFKYVNDRFGHSHGDRLLCFVAQEIRSQVRATDVVARMGGDEFALFFPETDTEAALTVLSKLRTSLLQIMDKNQWPVTLSIGVVTFRRPPESVDEMVRKADELMYAAKQGGKNSLKHETFDK